MSENHNNFMNYSECTDEELIGLYRNGDRSAVDFIMDKYKNLVRSNTKSLFLLGGETQDLIQEGMIGLFQAVNDYDFGRDTSFMTFADLCIKRRIYVAIKMANEKKHSFLNNYISLSEQGNNDENGDSINLSEKLSLDTICDPEEMAMIGELKNTIITAINEELSDLERENFLLFLTGMSSSEVARILGRSPKETDNAIQRAKTKLRKLIK